MMWNGIKNNDKHLCWWYNIYEFQLCGNIWFRLNPNETLSATHCLLFGLKWELCSRHMHEYHSNILHSHPNTVSSILSSWSKCWQLPAAGKQIAIYLFIFFSQHIGVDKFYRWKIHFRMAWMKFYLHCTNSPANVLIW